MRPPLHTKDTHVSVTREEPQPPLGSKFNGYVIICPGILIRERERKLLSGQNGLVVQDAKLVLDASVTHTGHP